MKRFYAEIEDHIKAYENGTITISDDIEFSMKRTVRQITHYVLSRYMDGGANDNKDPLTGKRRGFRNIGNAIVDIEWRAKNIDRSAIEGHAKDGDFIFSLVITKELQQWMQDENFGKTIDDYQRKKSEYGNSLLKTTEEDDRLIIEPVQWSSTYVDPKNIQGGMKIESNDMSLLELKKKRDVWTETTDGKNSIEEAIKAARKKKERSVEVLDIEGEFEACVFEDEAADEDETISLYNVIVGRVGNKYFLFYKTELTKSRYDHDKRKDVESRDFGMGVWEECFEPQIATNEAEIAEKDVMEVAGKVLIKTNKKGMPSAMELINGEMIDLNADEFFDSIDLTPRALPQFQNRIDAWFINMQRDQSAFPAVTGEESKAGTPFAGQALQAAQGGSIFNKRRDQDGFFLNDKIILARVLPYIVKKINKEHELTASYSPKELEQLDDAIAESLANDNVKSSMLSDEFLEPGMPVGFGVGELDAMKEGVKQGLRKRSRDKRTLKIPKGYITMERIKQKVRFDITNEMSDDQRRLNALATTLQALPPGDPQRAPIIQEMMEISGISAASFPVTSAAAPVQTASRSSMSKVGEVLPEGQTA